jgi:glucose/arabinose dehydrogenase
MGRELHAFLVRRSREERNRLGVRRGGDGKGRSGNECRGDRQAEHGAAEGTAPKQRFLLVLTRSVQRGVATRRRLCSAPLRTALTLTCAAVLAAGCSGSPGPGDEDTSAKPTTVLREAHQSPHQPIPRGRVRVTPLRSYPPAEKLGSFSAVKIADANLPAGLAVAPDGRILYSEFWAGRIRVLRRDGTVDPEPWADVNRLYGIRWTRFYHGGLSGIAFDPDYSKNRFVYVVTQTPSKRNGLPSMTLILRFKEVNGHGSSPQVLFRIRADVFDNVYSLVFGPDRMLYIPSGFLGRSRPKGEDPLADKRGKIHRVTQDGEPPGDNPFGSRAPRVWASGFKNAFDLAFFPNSNLAVAGESGPEAHDEINLVMPGHDYGYPDHQGATSARGVTSPLLDYGADRTSPVGIIYYTGSRYPSLRGRFLMCENHGRGLIALRINRSNPGRLLNFTPIQPSCTIDIVQTRNGSVVFSSSTAIYRLVQN